MRETFGPVFAGDQISAALENAKTSVLQRLDNEVRGDDMVGVSNSAFRVTKSIARSGVGLTFFARTTSPTPNASGPGIGLYSAILQKWIGNPTNDDADTSPAVNIFIRDVQEPPPATEPIGVYEVVLEGAASDGTPIYASTFSPAGYTGTVTVVTGFNILTCVATTKDLAFFNGLLKSVS